MAQTTRDFFRVFGLLSIWFLVQKGHAFEYKVGGSQGWTDTNAAIYNPWAEKNRFQIGDTLRKLIYYALFGHRYQYWGKNIFL